MRYLPLFLLLSCNFFAPPKTNLKIAKAYVEKVKSKQVTHDHRLTLCFERELVGHDFKVFGKEKNNYKLKYYFSSKKGWAKDGGKPLQKFALLDDEHCVKVVDESFYHPFLSMDKVVDQNFSVENITYIKITLYKYDLKTEKYQEIDTYKWLYN